MTPEEQAEWEYLIEWYQPTGIHLQDRYKDLEDFKSSYDYDKYLRANAPKRVKRHKYGFIYLLGTDLGWFKIGLTTNLPARMKAFGLKLPFQVELLHYFPTDDVIKAEAELHTMYSGQRINGEWFSLTPENIEWIKSIKELFYHSEQQ